MSVCVSKEVDFIPHIICHAYGVKCYITYCAGCGMDIISDCEREGIMKEKATCYGCDYAYKVSELTLDIVHQYGEVRLCGECLPKYGETKGVSK